MSSPPPPPHPRLSKLDDSLQFVFREIEVWPLWVCVVARKLPNFRLTDVGKDHHTTYHVDVGTS